MDPAEIELLIEECKEGASEPCFNLESGPSTYVNRNRYIELLEHMIRTEFRKIRIE